MWCLEVLPRPEAASRRNFHCLGLGLEPWCLGLGLGLAEYASVLLVLRGTKFEKLRFMIRSINPLN